MLEILAGYCKLGTVLHQHFARPDNACKVRGKA